MSESYSSSSCIHDRSVQTEHFLCCTYDDAECFVELPESNVGLAYSGRLQGERDCECRCGWEVDRCASGVGVTFQMDQLVTAVDRERLPQVCK